MVSISERFKGLKTKVKASIEKEKAIRKEEKEAYEKAKATEAKAQEEYRKYEEAQNRIKRIERAREKGMKAALPGKGMKAALPGHTKKEIKEAASKGASGLGAFLKKHVEFVPERKPRRPGKRKMAHKKISTKRKKQRRY